MATAVLAPSLARFRTSINTRWPERDHTSDGWIGDRAHQARKSDHNPDSRGIVHALDIDRDGVHIPTLVAAAILHPATRYVIYWKRIYHIDDLMRPKRYTGDNPHTGHVHVSIERRTQDENSKIAWAPVSTPVVWATLKPGMAGGAVMQLQAHLNGHGRVLGLDGQYGQATLTAVKWFQAKHGLEQDGWVGPKTQLALRTK